MPGDFIPGRRSRGLFPLVMIWIVVAGPAIANSSGMEQMLTQSRDTPEISAGKTAESCRLINNATASALLGGAAKSTVISNGTSGSVLCKFAKQQSGVTQTLTVTVESAADPHARIIAVAESCGANTVRIRGVGNEATSCAPSRKNGLLVGWIVGRVREQVFLVTIDTTQKHDSLLTRDTLMTRIYTAAEQVSGNLF